MSHLQEVWAEGNNWHRFALIALAAATVFQTMFIVEFARRPWYLDRVGRALMLKSASLALVLWLTLANSFFVYSLQQQLSVLGLSLVSIAIVYQYLVLVRSPRQEQPWEQPEDTPEGSLQ